MTSGFKLAAPLAVVLALSMLSGCSSAPTEVAAAPPPKPAAPAITLSPRLIEQASAYRYYMDRVATITPAFQDGESIARSLSVASAYEPKQLLRGAMAYGAVAALQDPTFVASLRRYAGNPEQRRAVANSIISNPDYVTGIEGSSNAAGLIVDAIGAEGQRLYENGKSVKQSAYDIQKQPWSHADVADRDGRLSKAKALSSTPLVGDLAETARLQKASTGAAELGLTRASVSLPYSPVVVRSLAVAALAVLGEAGDANLDTLMSIMVEPNVGYCMSMAKLDLYQCLAVSRPHYEDIFCLGQHAMMDTGRCMIKAAGLPAPYEAKFVPVVRPEGGYQDAKRAPKRKRTGKS